MMELLGRSNKEKKYFDSIDQIPFKVLKEEVERAYGKYERMRQTWMHEPIQDDDIYYKIQKGNYVTTKDIERAENEAYKCGVIKDDPNFKFYKNALEGIWGLGQKIQRSSSARKAGGGVAQKGEQVKKNRQVKFANIGEIDEKSLEEDTNQLLMISRRVEKSIKTGKKIHLLPDKPTIYEKMVEKLEQRFKNYASYLKGVKELMKIQDSDDTEENKAMLDDYSDKFYENKVILSAAKELTNFFYGPNNFYQKGAQEFIKNNKALFESVLKCDEKRYKKMLLSKKNLNQNKKVEHMMVIGMLAGVVVDAYGKSHKLIQKLNAIQRCYAD